MNIKNNRQYYRKTLRQLRSKIQFNNQKWKVLQPLPWNNVVAFKRQTVNRWTCHTWEPNTPILLITSTFFKFKDYIAWFNIRGARDPVTYVNQTQGKLPLALSNWGSAIVELLWWCRSDAKCCQLRNCMQFPSDSRAYNSQWHLSKLLQRWSS